MDTVRSSHMVGTYTINYSQVHILLYHQCYFTLLNYVFPLPLSLSTSSYLTLAIEISKCQAA